MEKATEKMDKTNIDGLPVYLEQRFRMPSPIEKRMGLWVDRIGEGGNSAISKGRSPERLRIFGQYCAVSVIGGSGCFVSQAAGQVPVGIGDVMILFPDEPAAYSGDATFRNMWVAWNGADAQEIHRSGYISKSSPVISDSLGAVPKANGELRALMQREDLAAILKRKTIVLAMIHDLFAASGRHTRSTDGQMAEAVRYLTEHCEAGESIASIATRFRMSATHFRRLFSGYTGRSPREFITAQRVSRAKALLSEGMPLKKVAALTGYEDVFYFMRVFKQVAGMPPGRFAALGR
jgi:AraC-like DNA-binding protein